MPTVYKIVSYNYETEFVRIPGEYRSLMFAPSEKSCAICFH